MIELVRAITVLKGSTIGEGDVRGLKRGLKRERYEEGEGCGRMDGRLFVGGR